MPSPRELLESEAALLAELRLKLAECRELTRELLVDQKRNTDYQQFSYERKRSIFRGIEDVQARSSDLAVELERRIKNHEAKTGTIP
jgi:hypothetical protein